MRKVLTICILLLTVVLVACGGSDDSSSNDSDTFATGGDAINGQKLYEQSTIGIAPGCTSCHSRDEGVNLAGPSHHGVGARASSYVAGVSAKDYLRESIINPDAHIVDGFVGGVMYQTYSEQLSESEVDDLVAYLVTLK